MRLLRYAILSSIVSLMSCSEDRPPPCIAERIDNFKNNQSDCREATMAKYEFMGSEVYTFSDGHCISDGGTKIIDSECNSVCFLVGIAGSTLCQDRDFFEKAKFLEELFRVD